jgi:hypothetical protein
MHLHLFFLDIVIVEMIIEHSIVVNRVVAERIPSTLKCLKRISKLREERCMVERVRSAVKIHREILRT